MALLFGSIRTWWSPIRELATPDGLLVPFYLLWLLRPKEI